MDATFTHPALVKGKEDWGRLRKAVINHDRHWSRDEWEGIGRLGTVDFFRNRNTQRYLLVMQDGSLVKPDHTACSFDDAWPSWKVGYAITYGEDAIKLVKRAMGPHLTAMCPNCGAKMAITNDYLCQRCRAAL